MKRTIEVCFAPPLFTHMITKGDYIVVIVDILRATTSVCAAFNNGAKQIIPIATVEEAKEYKRKGYIVASERDGIVLDFADFGNSPSNFTPERVKGNTIAYSTTNGTQVIEMAKKHEIVIGSFLNFKFLVDWLSKQEKNIIILCAGWKNKFNLEDSVFAGALVEELLSNPDYTSDCDSVMAAQDLWNAAKSNILEYIEKASHRHRLKNIISEDELKYCFTFNVCNVIPALRGNVLIDISKS